jgi:WD40 repeat protein
VDARLPLATLPTQVLTLPTLTLHSAGENINLAWSPNGNEIAVGNSNDVISFIDTRKFEVVNTKSNDVLVNEIEWNHSGRRTHALQHPSAQLAPGVCLHLMPS